MSSHSWADLSQASGNPPKAPPETVLAQTPLSVVEGQSLAAAPPPSPHNETDGAEPAGGNGGLIDLTRKIAGAILQRANQDAEKIRREASERGYREGLEEARRHSVMERESARRELATQVGVRLQEAEREYDESWNRLESHVNENLIEALMLLAGESLGKMLREQPEVLAAAMKQAIAHLDARAQIKFRLHPEDLQHIVGLSELPLMERSEFTADPSIEKGGFVVSTDGSEIDGRWIARTSAWREQLASGA